MEEILTSKCENHVLLLEKKNLLL